MRKMHSKVRKKTLFFDLIWTHRNGIYLNKFFVVSCWIACSAKMNECLTILFYLFFFYSKHFMSFDAKLQNALKNWIRVVRPPERFYFAISHTRYRIHLSTFYMHFQQKNTYHTILEMALKRTTTTHAIQIKIKAMNEKWPVRHEFSKAQDHIESSSSCFYATYQNTLPLNLCLHCNCWNDGPDYTKSYPYTYIVAQWIHLTHKKMQCSRNLGAVRCRCCC